MLSCADNSANFLCSANARTEGYSSGRAEFHSMDLGIRPVFKKNGAYPVLSDRAELIANSIAGSQYFTLLHILQVDSR